MARPPRSGTCSTADASGSRAPASVDHLRQKAGPAPGRARGEQASNRARIWRHQHSTQLSLQETCATLRGSPSRSPMPQGLAASDLPTRNIQRLLGAIASTALRQSRAGLFRNFNFALIVVLLASTPHALACGGGGSGSYRKPARPGQHQHQPQHGAASPSSENGSTAPQGAPR